MQWNQPYITMFEYVKSLGVSSGSATNWCLNLGRAFWHHWVFISLSGNQWWSLRAFLLRYPMVLAVFAPSLTYSGCFISILNGWAWSDSLLRLTKTMWFELLCSHFRWGVVVWASTCSGQKGHSPLLPRRHLRRIFQQPIKIFKKKYHVCQTKYFYDLSNRANLSWKMCDLTCALDVQYVAWIRKRGPGCSPYSPTLHRFMCAPMDSYLIRTKINS